MNVDDGRLGTLADALAPLVEHVKEQKAEIERLRAHLRHEEAEIAALAAEHVAKDAEIERLCALLTEAREQRFGGWHGTADDSDLAARIDAALGGGAPCATCDAEHVDQFGVSRVLAGSVDIGGGVLSSFEACPSCGGSGVAS